MSSLWTHVNVCLSRTGTELQNCNWPVDGARSPSDFCKERKCAVLLKRFIPYYFKLGNKPLPSVNSGSHGAQCGPGCRQNAGAVRAHSTAHTRNIHTSRQTDPHCTILYVWSGHGVNIGALPHGLNALTGFLWISELSTHCREKMWRYTNLLVCLLVLCKDASSQSKVGQTDPIIPDKLYSLYSLQDCSAWLHWNQA